MSAEPSQFHQRSFVYRQLLAAGATFAEIDGTVVATHVPEGGARQLALRDRCTLPRTGVKGRCALSWLRETGWAVPDANNQAILLENNTLVARLADSEALILATTSDGASAVRTLAEAIPGDGAWSVPRQSSNCWFHLQGERAVDCLQKLCGVDLRLAHFPPGAVAQTSIARLNGILIRDFTDKPGFHILADSASAAWFWEALLDAAKEFDGGAAGLND